MMRLEPQYKHYLALNVETDTRSIIISYRGGADKDFFFSCFFSYFPRKKKKRQREPTPLSARQPTPHASARLHLD
jgi:hypothetical protein